MFHACASTYDTMWLSNTNILCSMPAHQHTILCDYPTPTFYVPCLCINIRYYVTIQHQHFMFHACASTYDTMRLSNTNILYSMAVHHHMITCDHQTPTFYVPCLRINIRYYVTIQHQHFMFHACASTYATIWLSNTNILCSMPVHQHTILFDYPTPTFYVPWLCINIRYYVTIQHQHFMFHGCASTYDTMRLSNTNILCSMAVHQHTILCDYPTPTFHVPCLCIKIWYCVPITPTFCVPRLYNIWHCVTIRHHNFFFTVVPHHVILCDHSTVHQDSSLLCLHSSFVETEHPFFIRQIAHVTVFNCPALGNCILSSTVDLVCARRQIPCSSKELNLHQTWPSSPWASSPPQQDSDQCTLSTVGATQMFTIKSSSWYQVSGHLHI